MRTNKLISVRLDEEDIATIDQYCARDRYIKRSDLIYSAVALAAALIQNGKVNQLRYFYPRHGDKIDEFKLEYHRELKR